MHILFVEDQANAEAGILTTLDQKFGAATTVVRKVGNMQEAIETLEQPEYTFDLVVCDYHGASNVLLSALLSLSLKTPAIVFVSDEPTAQAMRQQFQDKTASRFIVRQNMAVALSQNLDELKASGALKDLNTGDSEFVRVKPEFLLKSSPIETDVYIRLTENKYCRLFRKGDNFDKNDLERYRDKKKIEFFYLQKPDYLRLLEKNDKQLGELTASDAPAEQLEQGAELALEGLHQLVDKMGFTPAAQKLAKSSVEATLKLIGKRPQLAVIMGRLKQDYGKYITSHSLVLAQISCALAYRIGWTSAPTYLKLSLASFLHDLPLRNNALAKCDSIEEVQKSGKFTEEELKAFKLHPIAAAEYAREFNEIPSDVDMILAQHHEKPDGSGFPRGLTAARLSPLSCLFIIAHDVLHFSLGEGAQYPDQFFQLNSQKYASGMFKKIFRAVQEGTKIDAGSL